MSVAPIGGGAVDPASVATGWDAPRYESHDGARVVITGRQKLVAAGLIAIAAIWLILMPVQMLSVALLGTTVLYLASSLARIWIVLHGWRSSPGYAVGSLPSVEDAELPTYTVLVPAYKEASQIPSIVRSMSALDYPRDKLEILILLEEDDVETRAALDAIPVPSFMRPVTFPDVGPRGKPRACNVGLAQARGEILVIYDAEDVPEPDQLRKAVAAFRSGGPRLGCVQAKLDFYNSGENLLTRWFTAEYATWFGLYLPGLQETRLPIPLGGTSNHLRISMLRALGGWDPWNVTEDADLGIRIARAGYETTIVDSVTWEEANSQIGNWIRQRSRWLKGFTVTWLVHMRNPGRLMRSVGLRGLLGIQLTLGMSVITPLVNPIFWILSLVLLVVAPNSVQPLFTGPIGYVGAACMIGGNILQLFTTTLGCWLRNHRRIIPYIALIPLYWLLMSLAAWKGAWQLLCGRAAYWEKTDHGLSSWSPSAVIETPPVSDAQPEPDVDAHPPPLVMVPALVPVGVWQQAGTGASSLPALARWTLIVLASLLAAGGVMIARRHASDR